MQFVKRQRSHPQNQKRHSLTSQHEIRENQSDLARLTKKKKETLALLLRVVWQWWERKKEECQRTQKKKKKKTHSPYREATQPYK